MKLSVWILCVCCWLGCALGCADESVPGVELRAGELPSVYNNAVPFPSLAGGNPPVNTYPCCGNEWFYNYTPNWVGQQPSMGGLFRTRPDVGYPGRVAPLAWFGTPDAMHPYQIQQVPIDNPQGHWVVDDSRVGYRQALLCTWDMRYPWVANAPFANKWCHEIPLRGEGTETPSQLRDISVFTVNDWATQQIGNPGFDVPSSLVLDFYGRAEFCSGPNFTGTCYTFGYNCGNGIFCHDSSVPTDKATFYDIRFATTSNGTTDVYPHGSYEIEFGFNPFHHGAN